MNTKQVALTLSLVLLSVMVASGLKAQQDRSAATNGRYALSSGQYTVIGKDGVTGTLQGVFKIDTATGRTWTYDNIQDGQGKMHVGWIAINEIH